MRKSKPARRPAKVLPLGMKNKIKTELPALVALSAIGQPWFDGQHQTDLLVVALVVEDMAPPESVPGQCAVALRQLCEQEITLEQKTAIALNLAECLPWLQMQQNHLVLRAIERVAEQQVGLAA